MSSKRIPCPHCGESILPEAKKCRFCGERLDSKNSLSIRALYWIWLTSIVIFFIGLFFIRRTDISEAAWIIVLSLLGLNILSGIVVYLQLMMKIINSLKTSRAKWYGLVTLITFIAFFGLLFNYAAAEAKLGFSPPPTPQPTSVPASNFSTSPTPKPSAVSKPTQPKTTNTQNSKGNQINCTGPDGKTFKTTQEECDNFNQAWGNVPPPDPNEVIQCNIHANCGGGSKEMTRASCEQITCCSLKSGNTLTSPGDCKNKQYNECVEAGMSTGLSLYYSMEACKQYK